MVCRHSKDDPECSSHWSHTYNVPYKAPLSPDASRFKIKDVREVNGHLIMKVLYPNCSSCSYEGTKVLVFLNKSAINALKWEIIDPHFAEPNLKRPENIAPPPAARFPASEEGWSDAFVYASSKVTKR